LRVLQERELRPLGAARSEKVDVRVLSATNRDLAQRMREGSFREDLFYRLNVIEVMLPPLRDRAEDVLPLSEHFLTESAVRSAKKIIAFTQPALKILLAYPWPGNVRELENVIERAVALAEGDQIGPDDLPSQVRERRSSDVLAGALARGLTLSELEREYINRVLQAEGGNKTRAAQRLGLDRKTLYRKLEEYGRAPAGESAGEPVDERQAERSERQSEKSDRYARIDRPDRGTEPIDVRENEPPRAEQTVPIPRLDPSEDFDDED
jgi:two-component system response regulator HydG